MLGFGRTLVEMLPLDLPELSKPSRNMGNLRKSDKTRTTIFRKLVNIVKTNILRNLKNNPFKSLFQFLEDFFLTAERLA